MKVSTDGRPWDTWCNSKRKGFKGVCRIAKCKGTPTCTQCYLGGKPNRGQFKKITGELKCGICDNAVESPSCPGRKVWEYNDNQVVVVMYTGNHTCVATVKQTSTKELVKEFKQHPDMTANQFVLNKITTLLSAETIPWESVDGISGELVNQQQINNATARASSDFLGNSFDAVCQFKKETERRDKYLIYKLNNGNMNNDMPTFVFKSSEHMAAIGLELDQDSDSHRSGAYVFLDAKHDRTQGMKTITMWTYDPTLRKLLCLTLMDVERENTETITLLWKIWNQILQEVSGKKTYKFNPKGWVMDENPARREEGLSRAVSCEFHFKQSIKKHANKTNCPEMFKELCEKLLHAYTCLLWRSLEGLLRKPAWHMAKVVA